MTSRAQQIARLAQAIFVVSLLILAFGFVHLFSSSPNPSSQTIDAHKPYVYAFEVSLAASFFLAIVATVLAFRAKTK
ncbi:hypothetical protein [Geothrix alkalitolerans]|jgi:hypothetical protein|uniref:hypothetical protein n=1 Tax=Geothrix alkalitolerans TaxID=2922724 RepID=UPI001FB022DA|nr:hypothetical protein [Geothrix alkalitolerans]